MSLSSYFPIWNQLTPEQQHALSGGAVLRQVKKGTVIHNGNLACTGPLLVRGGQLRAYILSDEGRQVTLYRLFARDMCLLSAPCMMRSMQFELTIEAEKDTELWIISPAVYQAVMQVSAPMANFTNEILITRFTEVMWRMEQIMWKSMDRRLAAFLLEEAAIEGTCNLKLTHETIANHLGTHREVITRLLRDFQSEGMVRLSRGAVEVLDEARLRALEQP